jgi:hypothetical protein
MYCRVLNWLSTDVSEVRAADINRALFIDGARTTETSTDKQLRTRQYIPEDSGLQFIITPAESQVSVKWILRKKNCEKVDWIELAENIYHYSFYRYPSMEQGPILRC